MILMLNDNVELGLDYCRSPLRRSLYCCFLSCREMMITAHQNQMEQLKDSFRQRLSDAEKRHQHVGHQTGIQ